MTDQTPATDQPHPLAALGIAAETMRANAEVGHSFAKLMQTMEGASHVADGVAVAVRTVAQETQPEDDQ